MLQDQTQMYRVGASKENESTKRTIHDLTISQPLHQTTQVKNELASVSNTHLHPIVLPPPSKEQESIICAINAGQCVTVRACAGSGKTTCMLQVVASLPPHRKALIITYNRALADDCKERIQMLGLQSRVSCYTIHGLVSKVDGKVCQNDHKLSETLERWRKLGMNRNGNTGKNTYCPTYLPLDFVMIDEAQDLRPLFYSVLSHLFSAGIHNSDNRGNQQHGNNDVNRSLSYTQSVIQLCLVGDPKQLLYDFATYGDDKASASFLLHPKQYWGKFTRHREWAFLPLSVSYRLTPNIASFCNLFWGTQIVGGNTTSPNIPVEYLIKYPYPKNNDSDHDKLDTMMLARIINEHGSENVLFLAQSVKSERSPIRVHVNELMKIKDPTTQRQQYNFHIKENTRGFEGSLDFKNKVRVWTFCGSKGCEADVVIVFGFDLFQRAHSLNQIGVALSRARKRLVVVHGKQYRAKDCVALPYYPVLGDSRNGATHLIRYGLDNTEETKLEIPPLRNGGMEIYGERSKISRDILGIMAKKGVLKINLYGDKFQSDYEMPDTARGEQKIMEEIYIASDFGYFSSSAEASFLRYGEWKVESSVQERIAYQIDVDFATTKEDVSALYGEAVVYMLQWKMGRYVPNIETVVFDGILRIEPDQAYNESRLRRLLRWKNCESLTAKDNETLKNQFKSNGNMIGKDLVGFLNKRMNLKKNRKAGDNARIFPVRAVAKKVNDDDDQLNSFLPKIRAIYDTPVKTPSQWVYLANAVMAFSNYHEKFRQIGTNPDSYASWVNSGALLRGLERLQDIMKNVSSCSTVDRASFEYDLDVEFEEEYIITAENNGRIIVGVGGVCDWIGRGLKNDKNQDIDLLEIKFVQALTNNHRLQVLVYCALFVLERNDGKSGCRGMLYNARTGEREVCFLDGSSAMKFLLDISQFKYNGMRRHGMKETITNLCTNFSEKKFKNICVARGTHNDPVII